MESVPEWSSARTITLYNGALMPLLGLGTYQLVGKQIVANTVNAALTAGYRLIDTASVYRNETDIGSAITGLVGSHQLSRSDIFITSKLGPKDHGSGKCHEACLRSLQALGVESIDLYLIHWPGVQGLKPNDERNKELRRQSWSDLEKLYEQGVIKSIGVSNYTRDHLEELLQYCRFKPAVLQMEFHPHLVSTCLVEFCRQNDICVQAYSSLGTSSVDNKLLTDPVVTEVASECGRSNAQVLLRWSVQQHIGVLPKSVNPKHIEENAQIFDFQLSADHMSRLGGINHNVHYCWDPSSVL